MCGCILTQRQCMDTLIEYISQTSQIRHGNIPGGGYGGNVFGSPLVLRIDIKQEPELRKMLRKGNGEPDEWYVPVGILHLHNEPLVISVGKRPPAWWS